MEKEFEKWITNTQQRTQKRNRKKKRKRERERESTGIALGVRACVVVFLNLRVVHGCLGERVVRDILREVHRVRKEIPKTPNCLVATMLNGSTHIRLGREREREWERKEKNKEMRWLERRKKKEKEISISKLSHSFFLLPSSFPFHLSFFFFSKHTKRRRTYLVLWNTSEELTLLAVAIGRVVRTCGIVLHIREATHVNVTPGEGDEERETQKEGSGLHCVVFVKRRREKTKKKRWQVWHHRKQERK